MTRYVTILEHLGLTGDLSDRLEGFTRLLAKWNDRINLTAATSPSEIDAHITDSLHVVPHLDGQRILDVGAGGGFPVVIAALCVPSSSFVALEPIHKKHAFLKAAARELGLSNLTCVAARVEDFDDDAFDVAMSRATFDLREWLLRGLSLVRIGGRVIGFEAVPREDLPPDIERHPYALDGKRRAIITVRRSS